LNKSPSSISIDETVRIFVHTHTTVTLAETTRPTHASQMAEKRGGDFNLSFLEEKADATRA
jgi:hypothetical protein